MRDGKLIRPFIFWTRLWTRKEIEKKMKRRFTAVVVYTGSRWHAFMHSHLVDGSVARWGLVGLSKQVEYLHGDKVLCSPRWETDGGDCLSSGKQAPSRNGCLDPVTMPHDHGRNPLWGHRSTTGTSAIFSDKRNTWASACELYLISYFAV